MLAFLRGVASIFGFWHTRADDLFFTDDAKAIESDWRSVVNW